MTDKIYKFKLSKLRDIGWKYWDPIGLLPKGDSWEKHPKFSDEYDGYLMQAAGQIFRGLEPKQVAKYLDQVATDCMGLSSNFAVCESTVRKMIETQSERLNENNE